MGRTGLVRRRCGLGGRMLDGWGLWRRYSWVRWREEGGERERILGLCLEGRARVGSNV